MAGCTGNSPTPYGIVPTMDCEKEIKSVTNRKTVLITYVTHRAVRHLRKADPTGPGDTRALYRKLSALSLSSKKRIGHVQARVLH
jgi:hypothetical protein